MELSDRDHFTETFLRIKTALPALKESGGGLIINVPSAAGLNGVPRRSRYTAERVVIRGRGPPRRRD
ncbi:SDR family NAD(P)-dependent oxidoreductase [Arthrobacter sp. Z1-9]